MWIFICGNLPLPLILYLNWHVTRKFLRVRKLSKHVPIAKPRRLVIGWWLTNVSAVFVLIPVLTEHRLFVQDYRWLVSYALAATFTITGLVLMNDALGEELAALAHRRRKNPSKPVDTTASDTL
ncbi:MAG TPA: hypothetical protein VMT30_07215 [Candidatus Saccharimonadia bacterium]|nr:hypothetical protein [Candidatus Saccharimonadia bacterium]